MEITKKILRAHFGIMWEYEHAVNLLERKPCNKHHLQPSLDWAATQIKKTKNLIPMLKVTRDDNDVIHFEETLRILEELAR